MFLYSNGWRRKKIWNWFLPWLEVESSLSQDLIIGGKNVKQSSEMQNSRYNLQDCKILGPAGVHGRLTWSKDKKHIGRLLGPLPSLAPIVLSVCYQWTATGQQATGPRENNRTYADRWGFHMKHGSPDQAPADKPCPRTQNGSLAFHVSICNIRTQQGCAYHLRKASHLKNP